MNRDESRIRIALYLSGEMEAVERADFEEELSADAGLRAEMEELRAMWDGLERLPREEPSGAVRARFYQMLNRTAGAARAETAGMRTRWVFRPWQGFGLAAVIFALGLLAGRSSNTLQMTEQLGQLRDEVQSMRQMVALSLLERQSANARLEGVSWGSRVEKPDREVSGALLTALNHDPNVNVRLSAVDALEKFAGDRAIRMALLDSVATQESPLVQIALIDAMVQLGDREAAAELQQIARNGEYNSNVRQRALWAVEKLGTQ